MRYLRTFENFSEFDLGRFSEEEEMKTPMMGEESDEECEPCGSDEDTKEDEYTFHSEEEEDYETAPNRIRRWGDEDLQSATGVDEKKKEKGVSYKKSGLKHPEKADLNKDKKISSYEKARGKAVQKAIESEKEERGNKKSGETLTAAQKKLPEALRKAIEAKKKGK